MDNQLINFNEDQKKVTKTIIKLLGNSNLTVSGSIESLIYVIGLILAIKAPSKDEMLEKMESRVIPQLRDYANNLYDTNVNQ